MSRPRRAITSGCGIAGSVGCDLSDQTIAAMVDELAHRGPDGRCVWSSADRFVRLGHRRLAIVGIDERGIQPMTRGQVTVACNGEVYNALELRRTLEELGYVFLSDCDTEVIPHAYAEWGVECVKKLDGVFALALYDDRAKLLVLARDPMGVRPLVYSEVGVRGLVFASEVKALLRCPLVRRQPAFEAIRGDIIHDLLAPKQDTWFAGIHNLEPGHTMVFDCRSGTRRLSAFWSFPEGPPSVLDEEEAIDSIRGVLKTSVRLQLLSDVGVSATLSGGVDSAAVTATILEQTDLPLDVFTIMYDEAPPDSPDREDLRHARQMAEAFPRLRLHSLPVSMRDVMTRERLDAMVRAFDGSIPIDYRTLGTLELYSQIRRHGAVVVLTGQGADELWMGYYGHPIYPFWQFTAEKLSADYLAREFFLPRVPLGLQAWNPAFLSQDLVLRSSRANLEVNYRSSQTEDPIQRLSQLVIRTHLRALLDVDDRLSMLSGVEARVPWLDLHMVELSFRVPGHLKIKAGDPAGRIKALARRAMRGLVPDFIIDRKKASFPAPPEIYGDALRALMMEDVEELRRSAFLRQLFDPGSVDCLVEQPGTSARDLLLVYVLWRFGELYRL